MVYRKGDFPPKAITMSRRPKRSQLFSVHIEESNARRDARPLTPFADLSTCSPARDAYLESARASYMWEVDCTYGHILSESIMRVYLSFVPSARFCASERDRSITRQSMCTRRKSERSRWAESDGCVCIEVG